LLHFGQFVDQERTELSEKEWEALIETLTSWVAREAIRSLDADERRRRPS
jgi:hypothetical protein